MTELFDPATLAEAADDPGRYVERYRFSPLLVAGLGLVTAVGAVSVVLTVVVTLAFLAEPAPATADVVLFGVVTAVFVLMAVAIAVFVTRWIHAAATHQVAFRADRHGITLGSQPYPPTRTVTVPWSDLEQIEIGWSYAPAARSVVLTLRPDAPRPGGIPRPGTVRGVVRRIRIWWTYSASGDVGRFMQGWRLDRVRLEETVMTYAPDVLC
jgi:hypothetical protein